MSGMRAERDGVDLLGGVLRGDSGGGIAREGRISFYIVRGHTLVIGADEVLPEDALWRKEHPRTPALICLEDDQGCHCPWGCVLRLVTRCVSLFQGMPEIEQILVLFKREGEGELMRRGVDPELSKGVDPTHLGVVKRAVPRIWCLWIPRDFGERAQPYRLFRSNYDGLMLVLKQAKRRVAEVPPSFWG